MNNPKPVFGKLKLSFELKQTEILLADAKERVKALELASESLTAAVLSSTWPSQRSHRSFTVRFREAIGSGGFGTRINHFEDWDVSWLFKSVEELYVKKKRPESLEKLYEEFRKTKDVKIILKIKSLLAEEKASLLKDIKKYKKTIFFLIKKIQNLFKPNLRTEFRKIMHFLFKNLDDYSGDNYNLFFIPLRGFSNFSLIPKVIVNEKTERKFNQSYR